MEDWWRHNPNQLLYKNIPEAQISLWTDPRITAFESAAAHQAPARVKMAQALKAKGSSAGESELRLIMNSNIIESNG
jgi:hypothetical protein